MRQRMGVGLLLALVACGGPPQRATGPTGTEAPSAGPSAGPSAARGWQAPVRLGPAEGARINDGDPLVTVDDQGRALAVWVEGFQTGPTPFRVQAARFLPASGWAAPQSLVEGLFLSRSIDVAMNRRGEAVVVVYDTAGENHHSAMLLAPDLGWSRPLHSSGFTASRPARVAIAEDGRVGVLWEEQRDPGEGQPLLVGSISTERGWQLDGMLDDSTRYLRDSLALAWDARGQAVAAWTEYWNAPDSTPIWASRGVPGHGWSPPRLLSASEHGTVLGGLAVAADREGNTLALWSVAQGLEFSRHAADSSWSTPVLLPSPGAGGVRLRVDGRGGAIAVWSFRRGGLTAASFDPRQGWSPLKPQPPPEYVILSGSEYDLGVEDSGRGVVVWSLEGLIVTASFTATDGWGPQVPLQQTPRLARRPRIAVNGRGEAFAVWTEVTGGSDEIWSARYVP